jgi:hypothetical protein
MHPAIGLAQHVLFANAERLAPNGIPFNGIFVTWTKDEADEGRDGGENSWIEIVQKSFSPMLALPKMRPDLVDDGGGGGFCSSEAVGARDWRIEYVRCIAG